ncbi:MAG: thioredoxin family protein [Polyangiales bacterium]
MRRLAHALTSIGVLLLLGLAACEGGENTAPATAQAEAVSGSDPFAVISEDELRAQIQAALARARADGKKVLLEFVADWCHDCREVVRVASSGPAAEVLASDYELIYVEVGRLDRHVELIQRYRVERIATLVVLDAQGQRVAQTTLEPLSNHRPLTSDALAGWLRHPIDHWQNPGVDTREDHPPVFPAEIVEPASDG